MGAGKSTVGRLLAQRWGVDFRDTDADVERLEGRPISEIFVDDGEPYFRDKERLAVVAGLKTHPGVLALGGGAVLDERTQEQLREHTVVFLSVGLSEAVKRVGLGTSRPLLLGNVRGTVKKLLDERAPIYAAVATATIDTDGLAAAEVVDRIEKELWAHR
ncbi:shikimate kinase [Nocardioidaceae bacterium]|nr:shikimate kinase [Nocardioidaceae bacterium]